VEILFTDGTAPALITNSPRLDGELKELPGSKSQLFRSYEKSQNFLIYYTISNENLQNCYTLFNTGSVSHRSIPLAVITSLKSGQDVFQLESLKNLLPSPATLENFKLVWTSFQLGDGGNQLVNFFQSTVIIVSLSIILQLVVSSLAAYPSGKTEFPGKNLVSILMLSTMMLPVQAGMIVNFITIRKLGLFDTYWQ
jgi:ABC-type glycerol-3-phosphate transport system permease component